MSVLVPVELGPAELQKLRYLQALAFSRVLPWLHLAATHPTSRGSTTVRQDPVFP